MMIPAIVGALLIACSLPAATYHVDARGLGGNPSDSNPGTAEKPWKSAMKAFTSASPGDTVIFRKGLYRMPRTLLTADLRLDPAEGRPFVFKAPPGEEVIITVMKPVKADDVLVELDTRELTLEASSAESDLVRYTRESEKALAAGCNEYETKPVDLANLLAKIEALLKPRT